MYSVSKSNGVKPSKAQFLNMEHKKAVSLSRLRKLVPNDLFDKQMKRARQRDINSRKSIFDSQTESGFERSELRKQLNSSTY
jgi:phage FluMu protein gp41